MIRRVVITAIGVISSLGNEEQEIIENIKSFNSNFKISNIDSSLLCCPVN